MSAQRLSSHRSVKQRKLDCNLYTHRCDAPGNLCVLQSQTRRQALERNGKNPEVNELVEAQF